MSGETLRSVTLRRTGPGEFVATNPSGAEQVIRSSGEEHLTPVELLLAGIAGCTALDVDALTSRRAEPESFEVQITADKVRDEGGNHLRDIEVTFRVRFPEGEAGDRARQVLPEAVQRSHDRLCTVSRTVYLGTPIATRID